MKILRKLLAASALLCAPSLASAEESGAEANVPFYSKYWRDARKNLRLAVDLSSRASYNLHTECLQLTQFTGLDLHKVFSGDNGDWGTAVVQLYLTRIDWDLGKKPFFFKDSHDFKLIPRIVTFNYTGLPCSNGRLNIKVGHIEIPFGLEFSVDNNGTLHQFMHGRNLGLMTDYGVTLNGVLSDTEYEVAFSRGSGVDYKSSGNPWLVSGRVGHKFSSNLSGGLSGYSGEVLTPPGVMLYQSGAAASDMRGVGSNIMRKNRVGVDLQYFCRSIGVMLEATYGRDFIQELSNNLAEVNWRNCEESCFVYLQLLNFNQHFFGYWSHAFESKLGVQWEPDTHWDVSFEYGQQIQNFHSATRTATLTAQGRYRF